MTKEELETEAREYLRRQTQLNGGGLFHCNILNLILGFAEPREKRIAELEQENERLILGNKSLSEKLMNTTREKLNLQKENAELKKNFEDSLIACGVLKEKIDLMASPSPIEAMQDVLITTQKEVNKKQKDQLIKAKELLKSIIDTPTHNQTGGEMYENKEYKELITEAEQFIKEEK